MLKALYEGGRAGALQFLDGIEDELRTAMLLCGARDLEALSAAPRIIGGELGVWLRELGLRD